MKRGHSTGKPTKAEAARMDAVKQGPCVCCHQRGIRHGCRRFTTCSRVAAASGIWRRSAFVRGITDAVIQFGATGAEMREHYGPSLNEGSKPFHLEFGSDAVLLGYQNEL